MPADFKLIETRQPPLKDQYDEWLARIICYAFSVPVSPFVSQVNRATGETLRQQATQEGLVPLKAWVKNALDHVIQECMNEPGLEFVWVGDDAVDPLRAGADAQDSGRRRASRRARRRGRIWGSGRRARGGRQAGAAQGWGSTIRITTSAAGSRRRTMRPALSATRRAGCGRPPCRSRVQLLLLLVLLLGKLARRQNRRTDALSPSSQYALAGILNRQAL